MQDDRKSQSTRGDGTESEKTVRWLAHGQNDMSLINQAGSVRQRYDERVGAMKVFYWGEDRI